MLERSVRLSAYRVCSPWSYDRWSLSFQAVPVRSSALGLVPLEDLPPFPASEARASVLAEECQYGVRVQAQGVEGKGRKAA